MRNSKKSKYVHSLALTPAGLIRMTVLGLFLSIVWILMTVTAHADVMYGGSDWTVSFTNDKEMVSSFRTSDLDDVIYGLQPGDEAQITLSLSNQNKETTSWYMSNKVLYSLEDRSANSATAGGAYTYRLSYINVAGVERVIFDSDTVGGEDISAAGEGLHEATDALEDFFYLDELASGQSGRINLTVALEGETQGNDYQDTLADLQMNFAVELDSYDDEGTPWTWNPRNPGTPRRWFTWWPSITRKLPNGTTIVKTGDDSEIIPYFIAMGIAGAVILILAIILVRRNRNDNNKLSGKAGKKTGKTVGGGTTFLSILLLVCVSLTLSGTGDRAYAAESGSDQYTYTVRIYAGAQGTIGGGEVLEYTGLPYGSEVRFNQNTVQLKDSSKYYIRGIRESGKDNNTVNALSTIKVTQDMDYVVAYGILGNSVAYTIQYMDVYGTTLAPSETYYGNVGDKPVLAYLYLEGYYPYTYNLTGTLSANAAENVFTFIYRPLSSDTDEDADQKDDRSEDDTADETDEVIFGGIIEEEITDGDVTTDEIIAGHANAVKKRWTEVVTDWGNALELFDIDENKIPLFSGQKKDAGTGDLSDDLSEDETQDGAGLLSKAAIAGIIGAAIIVAGVIIMLAVMRRKKKKQSEEDDWEDESDEDET